MNLIIKIVALFSNKLLYPLRTVLHRLSLGLLGFSYGWKNEDNFIQHLAKFYKHKSPIIFDVGLNVGSYSLDISNQFNSYFIYGFEPVSNTFLIAQNLLKKYDHIEIYNIGFGSKNTKEKIYLDFEGEGTASILEINKRYSEEITLQTIDSFCEERNILHIDYIKIDVEGYEFEVLKGASRMLENIDIIQFEFYSTNTLSRVFFRDFWELLHSKYKIYRMLNNGLYEIISYHPAECEIFLGVNYVAVIKGLDFNY